MRSEHVDAQLDAFIEGELAWWAAASVCWHLLWCRGCRRLLRMLRWLRKEVRRWGDIEPSDELRERIRRAIRDCRQLDPDGDG